MTQIITREQLIIAAQEYAKTSEAKAQMKNAIINYLRDEDNNGYILMDGFLRSLMTKEDWMEIAKQVGERICVNGRVISVWGASMPDEFEPMWFKA